MNQEALLIAFQVVVLVLAFSIHECAHAWTAWRLGDPTAKMLGRVTLNPLKHLDPLGSVFMPILALVYHWPLIGWAKPTPVTSRNFKNYRRDDILVTLAGPASNILSAIVALILINLLLFVFNLIPVPPLDGSHILRHFLPYKALQVYDRMGMILLIVLFLIGGGFIFGVFFSPLFSTFNHLLFTL